MTPKKKDLDVLLKNKGYKLTSQRKAVLETIMENEGKHLSSQEIYELVKMKYSDVGVATVYRTLPLLVELGLIYEVDFGDGCLRYELYREGQIHRHHHLVCLACGKITEVEEDLLGEIEDKIYKVNGFLVKDHQVKFYGYCSSCQNRG